MSRIDVNVSQYGCFISIGGYTATKRIGDRSL